MTSKQLVMCVMTLFATVLIPQVLTWTIDLPEVRKQHFKHDGKGDKSVYDNVENNSKLTEHGDMGLHDIYRDKYADDYKFIGYREKTLPEGLERGNKYLEGLRRSIDKYARTLEYCKKVNITKELESDTNGSESDGGSESDCERAIRSREHVRRLAELAVHTTKQLQDLEYEAKYQKVDEEREKELLMRLAFYLDELAHHTGFVPYPERPEVDAETTPEPATSTEPLLNLNFLQVPADVRDRMITCLSMDSSEPAPDRCAFPLPLPPFLRQLFNRTDSGANDSATSTAVPEQSDSERFPTNTARPITSPELTLTDDISQRDRQKRAIDDDPLQNVLQYYLKHNTWLNSNLKPMSIDKGIQKRDYDVDNALKTKPFTKRSIDYKPSSNMLPEDPLQKLHSHFGSPGKMTEMEKQNQLEKIKAYLYKIQHSESQMTKKHSENAEKTLNARPKRSTYYENPIKPIISQDPYQDISNYVKSQPGVTYNSNLIQAAQVRAGLERIFQNGNIEVVRRFGSNINPLVPFPFIFGILQSVIDI